MAAQPDHGFPGGPTIIVGVGGFGEQVLQRLRGVMRSVEGSPLPVLLSLDAATSGEQQVQAISRQVEQHLGLGAAIRTAAGDEGRPHLDVFVIADVADEAMATALPELVSLLARTLLRRFSNIFPGHDFPNLLICPVVALLGVRDHDNAEVVHRALRKLEEHASKLSFRSGGASPVARVFVVEQQSSRYELTAAEVVSTMTSFLALVAQTAVRQKEPLRSFLRSSVQHTRDKKLFASFGCATLELNLQRYGQTRVAAELVDAVRAASAAAVGAHALDAERLVPSARDSARRLQQPEAGEDLIALLRTSTPNIDFPEIGWNDTPEQIRDIQYGWGWFDALEAAVQAQVKRLDERDMDEVTRVADERGLALSRSAQGDVKQALRRAEKSGPHGWAQALRLAEKVCDRAVREATDLQTALKAESLPSFPEPSAVESAFRALREEAGLRPRPYRMVFFGALLALLAGTLLHFIPKWIVLVLLLGVVPLMSPLPTVMNYDVGFAHFFLDRPYSVFWVTLICGSLLAWRLRRYRARRHQELLAARDELKAAVRRYLTDEVGTSVRRYYESRLIFTLRAWALRALLRVRSVAEQDISRLSRISLALDRLSRELSAQAQHAERVADGQAGDLVYQTELSAALLRASYEQSRPAADVAERLLTEMAAAGQDDDVPGYVIEAKLRAAVEPFAKPTDEALARLAGGMVTQFVKQRFGKLGVPLEIHQIDERSAEQRCLFAPEWAVGPLEQLREELATLPEPQLHADRDRIHLLTLRTALTREAITLVTAKPLAASHEDDRS